MRWNIICAVMAPSRKKVIVSIVFFFCLFIFIPLFYLSWMYWVVCWLLFMVMVKPCFRLSSLSFSRVSFW